MSSRYSRYPFIQPRRKISFSDSDILHVMSRTDNIDSLANKYYSNPNLGWVIMCANPDLFMEMDVKPGTEIRIPMPLTRVFREFGIKNQI